MTFTATNFKPNNLSRDSGPWGREVEERIKDLERNAARSDGNNLNVNKNQNSSIDLVTRNIINIQQSVQTAINNITIAPSQITAGTLPGVVTVLTSALSGDLTAANVTGTNVFALSLATNITAARVALWGRTADGYIATATSSERFKMDIEPVTWSVEKLEAVAGMVSVYYHWIAAVQAHELDPAVPVHLEIGYIAERMHEAGLWEFVVYERADNDELLYNTAVFEATGNREPIPYAIHYTNWSIAVHAVVQYLWGARKTDRADLDMVLTTLGLTSVAAKQG